ncbi:MAG: hypothetical protein P4L81_08225 [Candidatus Pacebacteria bacterium]|nr:hypothetical protein [Candidatus Paceibacterota bacterium]
MTSLVRLAHYRAIDDSTFENELFAFDEALAHGDVVDLSISVRQMIEMCDVEPFAKSISVPCKAGSGNVYNIVSRIIHATFIRIFNDKLNLAMFCSEDRIDAAARYIKQSFAQRKVDPVIFIKTKTDGYTVIILKDYLKCIDKVLYTIVQNCAENKIFLERSIRDPTR